MSERGAQLLFYGLMLMLPLSALIVRRPPLGATLRMALHWKVKWRRLLSSKSEIVTRED